MLGDRHHAQNKKYKRTNNIAEQKSEYPRSYLIEYYRNTPEFDAITYLLTITYRVKKNNAVNTNIQSERK